MLNVPNCRKKAVVLAAAFVAAVGVGLDAAPATTIAAPSHYATSHEATTATEWGAARRQRRVRRTDTPDNSNASTAQPPSNSNFGYGVGDNSRYGGG